MSILQKILLTLLLTGILAVILLTWGSVGSAVLTLALLLVAGMLLFKKVMDSRDPDDFRWED